MGISVHQDLIDKNIEYWNNKPLLKRVYGDFYELIAKQLSALPESKIAELGSGMGNITETIPDCLRTDLFPYPWIDQIENAYALSFADNSLSDLIMIDVFHHLRYPGRALREFKRVLRQEGRLILLEPCISALGWLVYGPLHAEPIGWTQPIQLMPPDSWSHEDIDYYSGQGNATRIFLNKAKYGQVLAGWKIRNTKRLSALAYAASGGYSRPQIYPSFAYPLIKKLEGFLDLFPALFSTRLLVVLEKSEERERT